MHGSGEFLVIVHDVAPPFIPEIDRILDVLGRLVGRAVSAAVVPRWNGGAWTDDPRHARWLRRAVKTGFHEVLVHGWRHRVPAGTKGPRALLTGGTNEMGPLPLRNAMVRVRAGLEVLTQLVGVAPRGFVPPAWDFGPLTPRMLRACGISYATGFDAVEGTWGRVPLSTWSWEVGRVAALGWLGEAYARVSEAVRPGMPCIVVHPSDVTRGYLPRAEARIRALLAAGMRPVRFDHLAWRAEVAAIARAPLPTRVPAPTTVPSIHVPAALPPPAAHRAPLAAGALALRPR